MIKELKITYTVVVTSGETMGSSLEICALKNLTSEMDLLGSKGPLNVTDYGQSTISFTFFAAIQPETLLSAQLVLTSNEKNHDFKITGKVLSCSEPEKSQFIIQIQLRQLDVEDWTRVVQILRGKQTQVDRIFNSIKEDS
jgi:hypothetical protein